MVARRHRSRAVMLPGSVAATERYRSVLSITRRSRLIHRVPPAGPPLVHSLDQLSTRCGDCPCRDAPTVSGVSQTPTYDQRCGERINADVPASDADVPASEADLDPRTYLGRHHLREDGSSAAAVCGSSPGSEAALSGDWAGSGTGDSDRPGRHWLRDDAPGAVGVCCPAPDVAADLAESWS
jgi:hypothetical protein